ncbi:restriction endonuclease subunit S [Paenibacillus sp. F4]|uniref:restriction endonuclease subunit S n=1 Tax=Paenibacillus sp. F4 TaxID=357385 RepID=UPI000C9EF18A|nr:restriction endonuclease subunit S [Paenibacillus sp. F4]PNQ78616.1 hypothetical protein C1T21_24575 [Paenibacillus sp. F4]
MSKKKKNLDELLEEALVPEDEQPYAIPENWVWVKLKGIASVKGGKRLPKGHQLTDEKTDYPYIRVTDFGESTINIENVKYLQEETASKISRYTISTKDIYISIAGTIGKTGIIPKELDGANLTENAAKIVLGSGVSNKFLHYLFRSSEIQEQIFLSTVSSSQPKLALFRIEELYIPLPNKSEQVKIADKIEILFAKIDEAKQLIDEAKETFELRRAGILEAALKGELTTSFRKNEIVEDAHSLYKKLKSETTFKAKINPEILETDIRHSIPSTWKWVKLGDVLKITSGGTPKKAFKEYYLDGKVPWIKTGEIKWNRISQAEEHITQLGVEKSSAKWLPKNSVLVAMYGQGLTRGRAAILDIEATCNQAVCALLPSSYITPEYLYYYFMEGYNRFRSIAKGGNQENLSATMISEFLLPLPPLEEQLKIVELLDGFFNKELQVKELLNINVDEIKSAVLSKAFKGELGTNDPTDEPAIELLKSILQEKL